LGRVIKPGRKGGEMKAIKEKTNRKAEGWVREYEEINVYTDGGSKGNPGPSYIGIVITDISGNTIEEHSENIGIGTNNQAEYKALIKGLELSSKHCRGRVNCFTDSELVVRQVNGEYKIKNEELKNLYAELRERESAYDRVVYAHLTRNHKSIQRADKLLNKENEQITAERGGMVYDQVSG
jgi:ribonuclease HI